MGDGAEFGDVVVVIDEPFYKFVVLSFWDGFGAGHDPDILTIRYTDDGRLVGVIEISNQVGGFEGPDKLHSPFGIGLPIMDEATRVVRFEGSCEIACAKNVGGRNRAISVEFVTFDTIEGVIFDEGGNMCDDIPVTHEAVEVDASVDRS